MKLYTYFRSSAAYRVRIALNLKGLQYDAMPAASNCRSSTGPSTRAAWCRLFRTTTSR
jgi:glutathione S-transferase